MPNPFRLLLRVRYHECDAQQIVFNARYGEYIDIAAGEFSRAVFGDLGSSLDWRLVRQLTEWKSPARYDDVLALGVRTLRVGTRSFTLGTEISRLPGESLLATSETVYVVVDARTGASEPVSDAARAALLRGADGVVIDFAGKRG
ncbi:MAG: acyl-CoA thioesterase [Polyangiaceae bacterium]|nr:acyl-CoA thioesterase [Polyangiaceae bacterium]